MDGAARSPGRGPSRLDVRYPWRRQHGIRNGSNRHASPTHAPATDATPVACSPAVASANSPRFSTDFQHLFLKSADRVDGGAQIAIIKSDGSAYEELTTGGHNNAFPSFAPDGWRGTCRYNRVHDLYGEEP
jgi:hypothetical protein